MKKLLALTIAISILFFACSENTKLVDPLDQQTNNSQTKIQQASTELIWMGGASYKSSKFNGEEQVSAEQEIDLSTGGHVTAFWHSPDWKKTVTAVLHVPKGALKNVPSLRFYMMVDNDRLTIKFEPHPTYFDIPLTLDFMYTGIDLTGIDPAKIYFAYLDDPATGFKITNDKILIDKRTGTLMIKNGKIPHFSEYGFVRKP